jgi:hypothetical protein
MTIYLLASSVLGHWRAKGDTTFQTAAKRVESDYGRFAEDLLLARLNLNLCGKAFKDLTGVGAFPSDTEIRRRDFIDWWAVVEGLHYAAGRGYEPWVWGSTKAFLEVCGREGRRARLLI